MTPHTTTQPGALRRIVQRVRTDDHCLCSEEHELGVHALAVPLRNARGATIAALNAVVSAQRPSPLAALRALLPLLQEAAAELRPLL
ncbi:p-hydroxybenzoate hydroxylase transcriptional activator [Tepidimonas charontis]|uniref:p-hydroxybenzoate hydroxylase transcriptional activator n=1 Tax=Tepidimonas charontis TaxID=2267262 RepID=A0A554X9X2_9BURK|nr:p-hydroxybenzoate hydroxylase transcriptional activator [Tepidimonas charontis]